MDGCYDANVRTTLRIDDELLQKLKQEAARERISMTRLVNRALRSGLRASRQPTDRRHRFRETTFDLGAPRLGLDKALAVAARLEDEETLRKQALRK